MVAETAYTGVKHGKSQISQINEAKFFKSKNLQNPE